jgi:hypothetical protein
VTIPLTLDTLVPAMLACEQAKGQSVYQHGLSVRDHFFELLDYLNSGDLGPTWKLPSWLQVYRIQIAANLHDRDIISKYTLYHDIGKPLCRVVDADGKVHFPDHAAVSARTYLDATGDELTSCLIGWDMEIHTSNSEEITVLCQTWTIQDAFTLLIASLAELHSNAKLFGGIESLSFKMKFKTIEKRGKQICKFYFGEIK